MADDRKPLGELLASPWSWHRGLGLAAVAFFVWIALSGMLLVHADDLGLARRPVQQQWLLDLWGVPQPEPGLAFRAPAGWRVVAMDASSYLVGASATQRLPIGALQGVSVAADAVYVVGSDGELAYSADGAMLLESGTGLVPADATALEPIAFPDDLRRTLAPLARSAALDWKRVLGDLHAWRPAGAPGKLLADLLALALIALSLTGLQMWLQKRRAKRAAEAGGT